MSIEEFRADLDKLSPKQIFCKHYLAGPCHVLGEDRYFEIRDIISSQLSVEFSEVILVGSGKAGFSIAPNKRYRPFSDNSDIDIAVISEKLFTKVWKEAFQYRKSGAYWPRGKSFFDYIGSGWVRPDKLPCSSSFVFTSEWWDFFNDLTSSNRFGPFKIRAGLYHSWFFFFEYQVKCIAQCAEEKSL